jgi:hypothetical protein
MHCTGMEAMMIAGAFPDAFLLHCIGAEVELRP